MTGDSRREKARETIRMGRLPNRAPDRTWGGPGAGADCPVCEAPVKADELEYEIEFARGGGPADKHHVHVRCFVEWELERRSIELAGTAAASDGTAEVPRRPVLPRPGEDGMISAGERLTTYKPRPSS